MIPDEIIKLTFSFNSLLQKTIPYHRKKLKTLLHMCKEEMKSYTLSKALSLIFKQEIEMLKERVQTIKKLLYFMKKYPHYQDDYEYCVQESESENKSRIALSMLKNYRYNFKSPPFLYECLLSGCELPFCKSSTQCIDYKDVTDMIKYCPESVHFNMGYARCRNGVSPLWAILANRNVEVGKKEKIVQLLLKHGAKYTDTVYVNGRACSIKDDINSWS